LMGKGRSPDGSSTHPNINIYSQIKLNKHNRIYC
jgi:hypothetical protein